MATSEQTGGSAAGDPLTQWRVLVDLVEASHLAAPHRVPEVVDDHARRLGAHSATIYLADLEQTTLVPFTDGSRGEADSPPLRIDSTLAGRAYQHDEVVAQPPHDEQARVTLWSPLRNGLDRSGVLSVVLEEDDPSAVGRAAPTTGGAPDWLQPLATLTAELLAVKAACSDTLVNARRSSSLDLAAEIQWSLLPPLTFGSDRVTIAACLEPAYEVAGDSVDYAVEQDVARFAVFDGMGHGLGSAQLAELTVATYRNTRRNGGTLEETARSIDASVEEGFAGDSFSTGVLAELHLDTGRIEWVNAGHPEPLVLRRGRHVKTLSTGSGLPFGLGLPGDHGHRVGHDQLEPGDQVLLFTDGVIEARSPAGDQFGVARLVDLLSRTVTEDLPAAESMRRVSRALVEHHQARLTDDATMLLVGWSPGA
ncbi:MAG: PP2C family protein-serine/threonine phosphatase [Ornithinibacter sp.]